MAGAAGADRGAARLDLARRLLEESDAPVERVLRQSGFGSAAAGRQAFLRRLGLTPSEYRQRFRSAGEG
ncbi:MAG TPA: helix-turn-helix domain-containing protein [Acetobacteraceae bacterium]|nr:helix-turn-helix domain-containing protein [Acetobacteraceae bacterium]